MGRRTGAVLIDRSAPHSAWPKRNVGTANGRPHRRAWCRGRDPNGRHPLASFARRSARAQLLRDVAAVVLCGVCFGAGHGYQGALGLIQTTTAGIVLGAVTVWRKSLWPAIGAHLAIDAFGLLLIKVVARALSGGMGGGFRL